MTNRYLLLTVYVSVLAACASNPQSANASYGQPVYAPHTVKPSALASGGMVVQPMSQAAAALLAQAQQQTRDNQLDAASVTLERALRVDGKHPKLWSQLAEVRLRQGQYEQAESMARKSNSLAGTDRTMIMRNWMIIEQSCRLRGDDKGVKAAQQAQKTL
ncbi:MAG: tetratricopeptide repeat protein [Burkholderiales bacterium]|nr:MAG: tetratricopeptide repeat protein [Burkholderiales bacterium]